MNPVNERLGRKRGKYTERAQKKRIRQVANQLVKECGGWRSDLAKSYLVVDPDDEFERSYTHGEHAA